MNELKVTQELVNQLGAEAMVRLFKIVPEAYIKKSNVFNYKFVLTNKQRVAGTCYYNKPIIEISTNCIKTTTNKGLKNTITHELLHAIFKRDGHLGGWKEYSIKYNSVSEFVEETGVIERCYRDNDYINESNIQKYNYTLTCPDCGYTEYKIKKSKHMNLEKNGVTDYIHKGCKSKMIAKKI